MDEVKAGVADAYRPVIARPRRGAVECARLAGERRGVAFAPPCPSPFFGRAEADAINAFAVVEAGHADAAAAAFEGRRQFDVDKRSEEHTSELQSLMRISYAVFGLNKIINISP